MGNPSFDPADPVSATVREQLQQAITAFLEQRRAELSSIAPDLDRLLALAEVFTGGGKRLRPAFCLWGFVAAQGIPNDPAPLLQAAASLDVLHVSALVHDDVMDASDTRRGVPAVHRQLEALHRGSSWAGDSRRFGEAGAIILGDLLVMWSEQMLNEASLSPQALQRARPLVQSMRTEVTCGQYLDVVAQHQVLDDAAALLDRAQQVVEFKTARYTVQRPCQIGAALGGGSPRLQAALQAFGSPLGRAFQLRDDLLGVYGDEATTGKPAGDDLREGKRTVLIAHALGRTDAAGREILTTRLGRADLDVAGTEQVRRVVTESGARELVEQMITDQLEAALAALDTAELTPEGRTALQNLAIQAVRRDH